MTREHNWDCFELQGALTGLRAPVTGMAKLGAGLTRQKDGEGQGQARVTLAWTHFSWEGRLGAPYSLGCVSYGQKQLDLSALGPPGIMPASQQGKGRLECFGIQFWPRE